MASSSGSGSGSGSGIQEKEEEVRTIVILGLPADVRDREVLTLVRWIPGFLMSELKYVFGSPKGYVLFSTHKHAVFATYVLYGLVFDPVPYTVIYAELANANIPVTERALTAFRSGISPLPNVTPSPSELGPPPGVFEPQPPPPPGFLAQEYSGIPFRGALPMLTLPNTNTSDPVQAAPSSCYNPVESANLYPPTNLLFIDVLGHNICDRELVDLFAAQPGFKNINISRKGNHPTCIIRFQDPKSAANAQQKLQGVVLPSSGSFGLQIKHILC